MVDVESSTLARLTEEQVLRAFLPHIFWVALTL